MALFETQEVSYEEHPAYARKCSIKIRSLMRSEKVIFLTGPRAHDQTCFLYERGKKWIQYGIYENGRNTPIVLGSSYWARQRDKLGITDTLISNNWPLEHVDFLELVVDIETHGPFDEAVKNHPAISELIKMASKPGQVFIINKYDPVSRAQVARASGRVK
jgi:hypothetical protein